MALSRPQIVFVLVNVVLGAVVGAAVARIPSFAAVPVPLFGWLVLGVLLTDLASGYLAGAHPTAVITMQARIAALVLAFIASLIVSAGLSTPA
ncbi:MAG: hypothetical protein EKK41_08320 [Hyphomicrobiales bacterium]|nr:MAG: hypothetical protein EKK41_08320 [Hyphomicrobiales bacterium]